MSFVVDIFMVLLMMKVFWMGVLNIWLLLNFCVRVVVLWNMLLSWLFIFWLYSRYFLCWCISFFIVKRVLFIIMVGVLLVGFCLFCFLVMGVGVKLWVYKFFGLGFLVVWVCLKCLVINVCVFVFIFFIVVLVVIFLLSNLLCSIGYGLCLVVFFRLFWYYFLWMLEVWWLSRGIVVCIKNGWCFLCILWIILCRVL